jgi:putative ABC transport system ATP-binding protein
MKLLTLSNVSYCYPKTDKKVLKNINAEFEVGKMYAVMGKSGAGKTTLLSLISGLDICRDGTVLFNGQDIKTINRDRYRAQSIGVVFQSYNLLTNATAVENIVLSMNISGDATKDKTSAAYALLEKVGINLETAKRKILKLSGGEQQRVSIARAISHNPDIVIADEPTGNLDEDTENSIMGIFTKIAKQDNKCVIVVTHSKKVAGYADIVFKISNNGLIPEKSHF